VARLLLEAGVDPSVVGSRGVTPLMEAAQNGQLKLVRLLLEGGADPNIASVRSNNMTPLMGAAIKGQVETLRLLLARAAALDVVDHVGFTAFHHARNFSKQPHVLARVGNCYNIKTGIFGRPTTKVHLEWAWRIEFPYRNIREESTLTKGRVRGTRPGLRRPVSSYMVSITKAATHTRTHARSSCCC
jgi:hypothetical protein